MVKVARLNAAGLQELHQLILSAVQGGATRPLRIHEAVGIADYTRSQVTYAMKVLRRGEKLCLRKKTWSLPRKKEPVPRTHELEEARDGNGVLVVTDARPHLGACAARNNRGTCDCATLRGGKKVSDLARVIVATVSPSDPRVVNKFLLLIVRVGSVEGAQQALDAAAELLKRVRS